MSFNDSESSKRSEKLHLAIQHRDQEVSRACQRGDCLGARQAIRNYQGLIDFYRGEERPPQNTAAVQSMPGQQANGELAAPFVASPLRGLLIDPAKQKTATEKEEKI